MRKLVFPLIFSVLLTGCATAPSTPEDYQQSVVVSYDNFKKTTSYSGQDIGGMSDALLIRGSKKDGENAKFHIYVKEYYSTLVAGGWIHFHSAHDEDGNKLEFIPIDKEVDCSGSLGCFYTEDFGLTVTKEYLESHTKSGIKLKASGKNSELIYSFTPAYVQGFVSKINSIK